MFEFDLITGTVVRELLKDSKSAVIDLVKQTYLDHEDGKSVNPDSYFLRFPDKPDSRIIALPSFLGSRVQRAGIKWISSFPSNSKQGIPRASALLILNNYETGYPIACMEAAQISAARTAASAALAAVTLRSGGFEGTSVAVVGAGIIARNVCEYMDAAGCKPQSYVVHDIDARSGMALTKYLNTALGPIASFTPSLQTALQAETVVFATTASTPYVLTPFEPGQLVLNLSLRDLAPSVVVAASNIFDDVEHCLKANTSAHLAEQMTGGRGFVTGTLAAKLKGELSISSSKPTIFSPFGLGVLDLALGDFVHRQARLTGKTLAVPDFFAETERWSYDD